MAGTGDFSIKRDFIVRPVETGSDIRLFVDFPYTLYKSNPYWVPSLRRDIEHAINPKKNAFFEHGRMQCFLAVDASGAVIGRIAGIVNGMHLKKYNDGNGFFGFFETIERYDVAEALLDAASDWLKKQGFTGVRGPTNPSMNDVCGLLVSGFDREPSIMMPYNMPYYEEYLTRYGFTRAMVMWAYYVHKKYVKTDKLRRGVDLLKKRNPTVTIRNLDMSRFDQEAKTVLNIYNDAWSKNWGHVPMTENEFKQLAKEMKQVVDPKIVYILEDKGVPFAFSISLPNVNQLLKRVPDGKLFPWGLPKLLTYSKFGVVYECRTLLMGILQAYQGRGFDAMLNLATITEGPPNGYDASEMSWVLDSNDAMKNAAVAIGGVIDKEYVMMEKPL